MRRSEQRHAFPQRELPRGQIPVVNEQAFASAGFRDVDRFAVPADVHADAFGHARRHLPHAFAIEIDDAGARRWRAALFPAVTTIAAVVSLPGIVGCIELPRPDRDDRDWAPE